MSVGTVVMPPSARKLRRRVRRARHAHHGRSFGDAFYDLYVFLWVFGVYGGILGTAIVRHLRSAAPRVPVGTHWLVIAALLVAAGLAWGALRMVGPVLVTPAERTWVVSAPVERGALLRPRMIGLLLGLGVAGAVGAAAGAIAVRSATMGWSVLAGAAGGIALAATAVVAQRSGAESGGWARVPGVVLMSAGLATLGGVVAAPDLGVTLPHPAASGALVLAAGGLVLAAVATVSAWRDLGRLDAATLGAGAQVATASVTAAVGLDPSLLLNVLEVRRWRRIGSVRSRPFHAWPGARSLVLLEAEARRLTRRPGALAVWGALALAYYAVVMAAPSWAPVVRPILAYVAAGRLAAGLRVLARAPGLARSLGVGNATLRALHTIVPALAAVAWWLVTAPAGGASPGQVDVVIVAGVVGSVYRAATSPPMSYEGMALETPFGLFPVDLVRQLLRGPDLLGVTIVLRLLARG